MKKTLAQLKQGKKFLSFMGLKTIAEAISILTPFLVAKILSPEIFGSFSLFKMILFFGTAIFVGPLMTPLNIESNKEYCETKKSNKTFTSALIYLFISISLFLLAYLFFGKEIINFTGLSFETFKYVFLFAFFGLALQSFLSTLFLSQDNKKAHVLVEISYNVLLILYIIAIFYLDKFNLYNIFLGYFVASIITLLFSLFLIDYEKIFPLSFSPENFKIVRAFSFWVILGYTSSYLINWGDNLILRHFVSLKDIGVYNFSYQFFKGFIAISLMINTYFTPFISKNFNNKNEIINYLKNKRKNILRLVFPFVFLFCILFEIPVKMFFDETYFPAINIFRILSIGVISSFYLIFYFPIFNSTKNYKTNQLLLLLQVALNLLFDIILIPFFGIYGAAIGTAAAYIIYGILTEIQFKKILKKYYL